MNALSPEPFKRPEAFGPGSVWVDRKAPREFIGHTEKGVDIPIGMGEGQVSPGELLKLALIGCAGMSMDHAVARRLGNDFPARLYLHGLSDPESDRYLQLNEQIQLDLDGLTEDEIDALTRVIDRAISAACTVQRTVEPGTPVTHTVIAADAAQEETTNS